MNIWTSIIIGTAILGALLLSLWAIRRPERARQNKWLTPLTIYLSKRPLRRWTVNVLGAALLLWFANFYIDWIQPALTPADLFPPEFTGPVAVEAWTVDAGPVSTLASYTGTIEPYESNEVFARVDGFVETMHVYEGDYVRQGEVVAKLDVSELEPQLMKAIADSAFLAAEYRRAVDLFRDSVITASDFDSAKKSYELAAAQTKLMRARIGYATIRAGISGYLAERLIYPGQYVRTGTKLFRIDQLDRVRVKFTVPEQDLPFAEAGMPILLEFPHFSRPVLERYEEVSTEITPVTSLSAYEERLGGHNPTSNPSAGNDPPRALAFEVPIAVVFPALDATTRTGQVEVRLPNDGLLFKSNGYVVGRFALRRVDHVVRVPNKAVVHQPDGRQVVFVAPQLSEQGFAEIREVEVGLQGSLFTEIVSGVEAGERVIHVGMKNLAQGQSILVLD